jgi:hypothetical protein
MFLLLTGVLLGTYLALPLWLPTLTRTLLTEEWQLESLEFDYPFGFVLHVDTIVLRGKLDGIGVRVSARDLDMNMRNLSVKASSMDVDMDMAEEKRPTGDFAVDDITVPVIFRPGSLPQVSVASLRLNLLASGSPAATYLLNDFHIGRDGADGSRFIAELPGLAGDGTVGTVEINSLPESLEVQLKILRPANGKAFQIDFRQSESKGQISSEIIGDGDLNLLQNTLLAVFPQSMPTGLVSGVHGAMSFRGKFAGDTRQVLDYAQFTIKDTRIELGTEFLELDLTLEANREDGWIRVSVPSPGKFRYQGSSGFFAHVLDEILPVFQPGLTADSGTTESLQLTIERGSEFKLETRANPAGEFSGSAVLEFSSDPLDLSLELAPDSRYRMAELSDPQSLTGSGKVTFTLDSRQALKFEAEASVTMPRGASLRTSALLEIDERAVKLTDSAGFSAFIPRLQASIAQEESSAGNASTAITSTELDFHDLEFYGTKEFSLPVVANESSVEIRYSGTVNGKAARISQFEPGQAAPTLIDCEAITLQLDFSMSGEQLRTSGSGTLLNGQMEALGISASQVDFEWSAVDPIAMTGDFRTHTRGLIYTTEEDNYQGVNLDVAYTLSADGQIEGQGELLFASDSSTELRTPIQFANHLGDGPDKGSWVVDFLPVQISLRQAGAALKTAFEAMPGEIELGEGTIDVKGRVSLSDTLQGSLNINGDALAFSFAESVVEGASFSSSSELDETLAGSGSFSIERIALAAGLDLLQTRATVSLMTTDSIELKDFQTGIFDGHISINQIRLSPEGLGDTQIDMSDIDFGRVLEYLDMDGLTGTGKLEISLPAGSEGSSLFIRNGHFRAKEPGVLNYSQSMTSTPAENIGLTALENFHYSELDGTIDYHPDGSYQLVVHLNGSNPDLYDGYPIALSLNIGGMLPEAFEVLFLTGDFSEAILNRIKQEKLN